MVLTNERFILRRRATSGRSGVKKQLAQEIIVLIFFCFVFFCFCDGKLCAKAITTEDYSSRSLNCHRNLTRGHLAHNVPYWNKTNSLERGKVILKQLANG